MSNPEEYLALSGIQHYAFCRRQWALIHIERQWAENALTTMGNAMHSRAHDDTLREHRGNHIIVRGLHVKSDALMLFGQCDVVEFWRCDRGHPLYGEEGGWSAVPVEYKLGQSKQHDADRLQLCAQAICLEEMFASEIPLGYLFYGKTKSREEVVFDGEMRKRVYEISSEMHKAYREGYTPPAKLTTGCKSCSIKQICVPESFQQKPVSAYMQTIYEETP